MNLMIIVLQDLEYLDELIIKLDKSDINNISVISGLYLEKETSKKQSAKNISFFGSLKSIIGHTFSDSKIIAIVLKDEAINKIQNIVKENVPEKEFLLFTLPIKNVIGLD